MKQATTLFLILVLSWQLLFQVSYLIYWKSNQSVITAKFCENKNRPQMHCNGKCHLMKTLNKLDQNMADRSRIPLSLLKMKLPDALIPDWNLSDFGPSVSQITSLISRNSVQYFPQGFPRSVYDPPDFF